MKKLFLSLSLVAFSLFAFAQVLPPKQVSDAFGTKFSGAENVAWSQESPMEWEAEFMMAGVDKSASFSPAGEWLETESACMMKDCPAEIFKTLALVFDGFKIEECESVERKGFTGYDIVLVKGGTEVEISASADGTFKLTSIEVGCCGGAKCSKGMMGEGCKGMMGEGCKGMMGEGCKGKMEGCSKGMMGEGCKGMMGEGCKGMMEEGCKGKMEGSGMGMGMMEGCCKAMMEGCCKAMMEGCAKGIMEGCCKGMMMQEGSCKGKMDEGCCKGKMEEGSCKGEAEKSGKEGKEKGGDKDKD
jgi:hypothetical protein